MEREAFFDRIALALGRGRLTVRPHQKIQGVPPTYALRPNPAAGDHGAGAQFQAALAELGAHCIMATDRDDASDRLERLLDELSPQECITWGRREFDGWPITWLWDRRGARDVGTVTAGVSDDPQSRRDALLRADVGITLADCAVANTGTLMLTTTPGRPRSVSLLPAVHIALVDEVQIVGRLGEALQRIAAADAPSSINFISGPSRSGDIEGDLSVGVHGPAAVYVIVAGVRR